MKNKTEKIAVSTRDLGCLLESIAKLSIKGNSNENALIDLLECFEPLFQKILRTKKFMRFNDGKNKTFYICETQDDCNDYIFRAFHEYYNICENSARFIAKQISFEKFAKLTKGEYMNFSLYSIGDDGNLLFERENQRTGNKK